MLDWIRDLTMANAPDYNISLLGCDGVNVRITKCHIESRKLNLVESEHSSSAARETGTHARRELRNRERLGQVVARSELEAGTSIDLVILCRQHEDW